ncbi:MAG: FkbM family methyltransferase [Planctomycetes bacterium]|nr:FkbM family methyltransferase [Planctomycetota bacterium]
MDPIRPRLPLPYRLALPYLRAELPAWGRLYQLAGGNQHRRWHGQGRAIVRGKLHGYEMELDLGNWSERLTFSLGRYHDLPIQVALRALLRPGDTFVDIGANLGMLSLLGARLVGDQGQVVACEPNPTLRARLDALVQRNHLTNFQVVAAAFGNASGTAELHEYAGHSGWGSLSTAGPGGMPPTRTHTVPLVTGDQAFADLPARPTVMKIDVEGHEVPVLQGLRRTLGDRQPAVFLEVADAHQRRAGHSAAAMCGELERLGYAGFALTMPRTLRGRRLRLVPIAACRESEFDALFAPARGPLAERITALLR